MLLDTSYEKSLMADTKSLPLWRLFSLLKARGFSVDERDIIEFIAVFDTFPDGGLKEHKFYLSPLVSTNIVEQELFYKLYDQWLAVESNKKEKYETPGDTIPKKGKKLKTKLVRLVFLSVLAFFLLLTLFVKLRVVDKPPPVIGEPDSPIIVTIEGPPLKAVSEKWISRDGKENRESKEPPEPPTKKSEEISNGYSFETYIIGKLPDNYLLNLKVNRYLLILISVLATLAIYWLGFYLAKLRLVSDFLSKKEVMNIAGDEKPFIIPFDTRDHLIIHEPLLQKASNSLKKTLDSEEHFIDITNTLKLTINNHGLFSPVYNSKKQERNYLVLIDHQGNYDQQINLFKYLIKVFKNQGIKVDYYSFYKNPELFFNHDSTSALSFKDLKRIYSESILIIVSNGYKLLHSSIPLITPNIVHEIQNWQCRFLVTPVPYHDWKMKEKILNKGLTLVPADLFGWVSILQMTESETPKKDEWKSYTISKIDFEEVDELENYLKDEDLFQWVCAIAIHHHIRWEILIELGFQVLKKNKMLYKLNFSNLLKIARIPWISDGLFPTNIRLELLKKLSEENELLARETMIQMLEESNKIVEGNSLVYKDKLMQGYIDKFILFANNPQKFKIYEKERDIFMSLWTKNYISDISLSMYLSNDAIHWETPVRSIDHQHIKMDEYLKEWNPNKVYLNFERCLSALVCVLFHFAILYVIFNDTKGILVSTTINKYIPFISDVNSNSYEDTTVEFAIYTSKLTDKNIFDPKDNPVLIYTGPDGVHKRSLNSKIKKDLMPDSGYYDVQFEHINTSDIANKHGTVEIKTSKNSYKYSIANLRMDKFEITFTRIK